MLPRIDQTSLLGMVLGIVTMLQPWCADGLRVGFFVTLTMTVLQIVVGRLRAGETQR